MENYCQCPPVIEIKATIPLSIKGKHRICASNRNKERNSFLLIRVSLRIIDTDSGTCWNVHFQVDLSQAESVLLLCYTLTAGDRFTLHIISTYWRDDHRRRPYVPSTLSSVEPRWCSAFSSSARSLWGKGSPALEGSSVQQTETQPLENCFMYPDYPIRKLWTAVGADGRWWEVPGIRNAAKPPPASPQVAM